jgi:hypothetical protein
MGDMLSFYIDRVVPMSLPLQQLPKKKNLLAFANRIWLSRPSGPTPATVDVTFTNNGITNIAYPYRHPNYW